MEDPEIDIQWIPEEGFFVIDGVEITPETLKKLVHSYNDEKAETTTESDETLEDLVKDMESLTSPKIDWKEWIRMVKK